MLTGPTSKRAPFNWPRSTNKTVADDSISQIRQ